jgi:hypothetical protein
MDEKTFLQTGPFASVTVVSSRAGIRLDADARSARAFLGKLHLQYNLAALADSIDGHVRQLAFTLQRHELGATLGVRRTFADDLYPSLRETCSSNHPPPAAQALAGAGRKAKGQLLPGAA